MLNLNSRQKAKPNPKLMLNPKQKLNPRQRLTLSKS